MGLKRMAGSLPLIFLSFLVVVSAQPLEEDSTGKSSPALAANASSSSAATIEAREGFAYQVDQQRPVVSENNSFDYRFQPKTTGKGSWTAIKIWGGEEKRTSRADRVVSSATESRFTTVNFIFTALAALATFVL